MYVILPDVKKIRAFSTAKHAGEARRTQEKMIHRHKKEKTRGVTQIRAQKLATGQKKRRPGLSFRRRREQISGKRDLKDQVK